MQERFTYDPKRRWLASKQTTSTTPIPAGAAIPVQNLTYGFDVRGDIRSLRNQVPATAATLLNGIIPKGPVSQAYSYDDFHRLTDATGQAQTLDALSAVQKDAYVQRFDYDDTHNLTRTTLTSSPRLVGPVVTLNTGGLSGQRQTQAYAYSGNSARPINEPPLLPANAPRDNPPHAPSQIGTRAYYYDTNGNRIYSGPPMDGGLPVSDTKHLWDEEQRLQVFSETTVTIPPMVNNGSYQYDH